MEIWTLAAAAAPVPHMSAAKNMAASHLKRNIVPSGRPKAQPPPPSSYIPAGQLDVGRLTETLRVLGQSTAPRRGSPKPLLREVWQRRHRLQGRRQRSDYHAPPEAHASRR